MAEKLKHPPVLMPPPLIYLGGMAVGYGLDRALDLTLTLPLWSQLLSIPLVLIALLLIASTLVIFRRHRTTVLPHRAASTLVTAGPFRYSRNPIYLGFSCLHVACALSLASPGIAMMLVPVLFVMDRHVIAAEEAFHAQQFGDQWHQYRQQVRRWL